MDFETLQRYYDLGLYDKESLKIFVKAMYISADEYKTITGEAYTA